MDDLPPPWVKNKSLSPLTTLGVGGKATYCCEAKSAQQVEAILTICKKKKIPFLALGKGSNALFDDRGFNGLILLVRIEHLQQRHNHFTVGGGVSFARLGNKSVRAGFSGLEFAAAIPASVGGAIYMNAGASGQQTADTLVEVSYVTQEGNRVTYKKEELEFGYRHSCFQNKHGVIVEATFALTPAKEARVHQKQMVDYRLKTQPYGQKSAGCAFRNPNGGKSAAFLIEASGLKGFSIGGAKISLLHANFIVNESGATASDVQALLAHVKQKVFESQGVHLEEEIRTIPYEL